MSIACKELHWVGQVSQGAIQQKTNEAFKQTLCLSPVYACIESLYRYKSLILHCILISYYISVVIVNDSMEFLLLPVSKGYRSVRDFRRCVRDAPPNGAAFTFACICI